MRCCDRSAASLRRLRVETDDPVRQREREAHHLADGQPARQFAGRVPAHAVGDDERVAGLVGARRHVAGRQAGADALEVAPDAGDQEVVFVVGADVAGVRQTERVHHHGRIEGECRCRSPPLPRRAAAQERSPSDHLGKGCRDDTRSAAQVQLAEARRRTAILAADLRSPVESLMRARRVSALLLCISLTRARSTPRAWCRPHRDCRIGSSRGPRTFGQGWRLRHDPRDDHVRRRSRPLLDARSAAHPLPAGRAPGDRRAGRGRHVHEGRRTTDDGRAAAAESPVLVPARPRPERRPVLRRLGRRHRDAGQVLMQPARVSRAMSWECAGPAQPVG